MHTLAFGITSNLLECVSNWMILIMVVPNILLASQLIADLGTTLDNMINKHVHFQNLSVMHQDKVKEWKKLNQAPQMDENRCKLISSVYRHEPTKHKLSKDFQRCYIQCQCSTHKTAIHDPTACPQTREMAA